MGLLAGYEAWHRDRANDLLGDADELEGRIASRGYSETDKADLDRMEEAHKRHLARADFAVTLRERLERFHLISGYHA